MRVEDKNKIYANYKIIVDNVDFDEIKDYLYSNIDEFTNEDMEFINSKSTKPAKMRELIKILNRCTSPDVLTHFCESLNTNEIRAYQTLANVIVNTDPSTSHQHFDNIDASTKDKIGKLTECCKEQTSFLRSDNTELNSISQFMKLSKDGDFILNENIEEFSKYRFKNVNLRVKKDKNLIIITKEIACQLGEDVLASFSSPKTNKYTNAMRKLIKNLSPSDKRDISDTINNMHILEMVGFPAVEAIAKELYTEINWGRIVAWFAFWKEMADYLDGQPEDVKYFGSYVGFYVALTCGKWINENGGWDHLLKMSGQYNQDSPGYIRMFLNFITRGYYS